MNEPSGTVTTSLRAARLDRWVVGVMSLLAAPLFAYYAVEDFRQGSRWLPWVQALMVLPALGLPLALWKGWHRERWLRLAVVGGLAGVFYLAVWDELPGDISSLVWVMSVPPVAFLGLGRQALPLTLGFGALYYTTIAFRYSLRGVSIPYVKESVLTYGISIVALSLFVTMARWYREALLHLAQTDPLTGIPNRLAFWSHLTRLLHRREPPTLTLVMFDLDDFKRVNDTHGHEVGDALLIHHAREIQRMLPPASTLYRWGGEEFLILLEGNLDRGLALAERVRRQISRPPESSLPAITGSFGVATWRKGEPVKGWIARADRALYQAKRDGKNCVRVGHPYG